MAYRDDREATRAQVAALERELEETREELERATATRASAAARTKPRPTARIWFVAGGAAALGALGCLGVALSLGAGGGELPAGLGIVLFTAAIALFVRAQLVVVARST